MPSIPRSPTLLASALAAAVGMLGAGCGDADTGNDRAPASPPSTRNPGNAPTTGQTGPSDSGARALPSSTNGQKNQGGVKITIGEQRFRATLSDSAAARDLIAQLPVTIEMVDHGAVEKTGALPSPLSLDGQPEGADPDVGDLGYYAPGNDLVFYYGDQSYNPGIVILGRLDGNAAQRISDMEGPLTATIETDGD